MNKHPIWAGVYFVFLVACLIFLPSLARVTRAGSRAESLRAELRGNDSRQPIFRGNYRNDIHFLLFSSQAGTKVFQEWCSWGFYTRSFTARTLGGAGKSYTLQHTSRGWTKNFPATHTLDAGQFLITSVDLCDGSWKAEPALPLEDMELEVTGHFRIAPDEETREQKVWTGELTTKPLVIILARDCAEVLNKSK